MTRFAAPFQKSSYLENKKCDPKSIPAETKCLAENPSEVCMKNVDYQYHRPRSIQASLILFIMGCLGMKKRTEQKMLTNSFKKEPEEPPQSLLKHYHIDKSEQKGRKIWTIAPKENASEVVVLYLHGGAYMANITRQHWDFIELIIHKTKATFVVPDYPLSPEASCPEVYEFVSVLYTRLASSYPAKRMVFMGDSAGGGLALGMVQQLRNEQQKQPEQLILFSPWLDVSMSNPHIELVDRNDKILSMSGLQVAGQQYAGTLALNDFRVSPLYGNFKGLCSISMFTGTHDLLHPDAQKCKQLMVAQQLHFNYFMYPGMFHDWVIIKSLKETLDVINKVHGLLHIDE